MNSKRPPTLQLPISIIFCFVFSTQLIGQNLVPNGSFEEFIECPETLDNLDSQCVGWFNSRGTCDYFNSCAPLGVSVPQNVLGWQEALTGEAYAGFFTFRTPSPDVREHLSIQLVEPLQIGVEYFLSFYLSSGYNSAFHTKATNGQGAYFSTVEYSSIWDTNPIDNPSPIYSDGIILNEEILTDSTDWVQLKGNFIADSAYNYLVVGGMLLDSELDSLSIGDPLPYGEAYYYIDEVRLSTDSNFVNIDLTTSIAEPKDLELSVYPNPTTGIVYFNPSEVIERFTIYGMDGTLLMTKKTFSNVIDLSTFPLGFYIIEFIGRETKSHVKVVKYH